VLKISDLWGERQLREPAALMEKDLTANLQARRYSVTGGTMSFHTQP